MVLGLVFLAVDVPVMALVLVNLPLHYLPTSTSIAGRTVAVTILDLHVTTRPLDIRIQRRLQTSLVEAVTRAPTTDNVGK